MMEIRTLDQDKNNNHLSVFRSNDGDIFVTVYEQKDRNSLRVPHTVRIGSANSGHKRPSDILVALSNLAECFERYENCETMDEALMKEMESSVTPSVDFKFQGFGEEKDLLLSFISAVHYAKDNGYKGENFDRFLHRHFMEFHPAENSKQGSVTHIIQKRGIRLNVQFGTTLNDFVLSVRNGTENNVNDSNISSVGNETEDKYGHPIIDSNISSVTKNLLIRHGYKVIEKVALTPISELESIKGMGPARLAEIKDMISTFNPKI